MLVVGRFRRRIVSDRRPRCEHEQQARVLKATQSMALAGVECDQRSGLALYGLGGGFDRDPARKHLHDRSLADVMIAHPFSAAKVEHHDPAFGRREQDTWILMTDGGHARRVGPRLALDALLG